MTTKNNMRTLRWKELYDEAVLESNSTKLRPLLNEAINIVLDRIEETVSPAELDELNAALNCLRSRRKAISPLGSGPSESFNPNKAA